MKKFLPLVVFCSFLSVGSSQTKLEWTGLTTLNSSKDISLVKAKKALDGGYFVHAQVYEDLVFPNQTISKTASDSIFLIKVLPSGNVDWYTELTSAAEFVEHTDGSVYLTGTLSPFLNNRVGGQTFIPNDFSTDIFVARINSSGVFQWREQYGYNADEYYAELDVDADGNVYVIGSTASKQYTGTGFPPDDPAMSIVGYDKDGNEIAEYFYDGNSSPQDVEIVGNDLQIVGSFYDIKFGNTTYTQDNLQGIQEVFLVSVNKLTGVANWIKTYGTINPISLKLFLDGSNDLYVSGSFSNTLDFTAEENYPSGGQGGFLERFGHFVAKFNGTNGNAIWQNKLLFAYLDFAKPFGDIPESAGIDAQGNVYLSGVFNDTLYTDDGYMPNEYYEYGQGLYVAAFNPQGEYVDAMQPTITEGIVGNSVLLNQNGVIEVWGIAGGDVDFGNYQFSSAQYTEVFYAPIALTPITSLYNNTDGNTLAVFPSPSSTGDFYIESSQGNILTVEVFDMVGNSIKTSGLKLNGNKAHFSLAKDGNYMVSVVTATGQFAKKVMVK